MKKSLMSALIVTAITIAILSMGCQQTAVTPSGTYYRVRPAGPVNAQGGRDAELWRKRGEPDSVYTWDIRHKDFIPLSGQ